MQTAADASKTGQASEFMAQPPLAANSSPSKFEAQKNKTAQQLPPMRFAVDQENVSAAARSGGGQTEEDEKFHEMVSVQVRQTVKAFEWKLDSVRKEREAVIDIIESIVKEVFEPKRHER